MTKLRYLEIREVCPKGKPTPNGTHVILPIVRENDSHYVTHESFTLGIVGLSAATRRDKKVRWSKATMKRAGDSDCSYTPTLAVLKVHDVKSLPSHLPIIGV